MSVRTGKGDSGFTELLFQRRVSKDSPDMRAIGDLDELNAYLGLVKIRIKGHKKKDIIARVQRAIHTISSEIALGSEKTQKNGRLLSGNDTDWIKSIIYELERKIDIKTHFYLPGDNELSALFDVSRAITRRAERSLVAFYRKGKIENKLILSYINCLSDVLFVLAREKPKTKKKKTLRGPKRKKDQAAKEKVSRG